MLLFKRYKYTILDQTTNISTNFNHLKEAESNPKQLILNIV